MSTRRPLGTGPTTTTPTTTDSMPRLLPVERMRHDADPTDDGRQELAERYGRRPLGRGTERTP